MTACSLDKFPSDRAIVESLSCADSAARRLKSLGIFAGQQIQVARRGNPLIIQAAGSRIAVAEDIAKEILVRELEE